MLPDLAEGYSPVRNLRISVWAYFLLHTAASLCSTFCLTVAPVLLRADVKSDRIPGCILYPPTGNF